MIKRFLVFSALLVLLAAIGAGALVYMFIKGQPGVGNWVAQQVVNIANTYLVPQISFDTFAYDHPGRLTLNNVVLTAPAGERVVEMPALRVQLAEIPRRGRPIVIESVEIYRGSLQLIQRRTADGSIEFAGLVPAVRTDRLRQQDELAEEVRLSNVLQMRRIAITDGALTYDAGDGQPPMSIPGLTLDLDIEPVADSDEPGWYGVSTHAERRPIWSMDIDGRFNLDTFIAEILDLTFRVDLTEEGYVALPPQLQSLLRQHDLKGNVLATGGGRFPLTDPTAATLSVDIKLKDMNAAFGNGRLPIQDGEILVEVNNGLASLGPMRMNMLQGVLDAGVEVELNKPGMPTQVRWRVEDVQMQDALRTQAPEGQPPRIAGALDCEGQASLLLTEPFTQLTGKGELSVADGRLVLLPIINELAAAMNLLDRVQSAVSLRDRATATFTLTPEAVNLSAFEVVSQVVAARGSGNIYYDGRLDLIVNAGPLERVQNLLGDIGGLIGRITDQLVRYRVRGTIENPSVSMQPLRIGS